MLIGVLAVTVTVTAVANAIAATATATAVAATVAAAIAVTTAFGVAGAAIGTADAFLSAFFRLNDVRHGAADDKENGGDGKNLTEIHDNTVPFLRFALARRFRPSPFPFSWRRGRLLPLTACFS